MLENESLSQAPRARSRLSGSEVSFIHVHSKSEQVGSTNCTTNNFAIAWSPDEGWTIVNPAVLHLVWVELSTKEAGSE